MCKKIITSPLTFLALDHQTMRQLFLTLETFFPGKTKRAFNHLMVNQTSGIDETGSEGRSTFMVDGWKMGLLQQILDQHTTREWI